MDNLTTTRSKAGKYPTLAAACEAFENWNKSQGYCAKYDARNVGYVTVEIYETGGFSIAAYLA